MKYVINISYDGSKYCGLQKLTDKLTVQGELEKVLTKMNEATVSVKASGRTDKGVHAINQTCHFELTKQITPYRLRYYINKSTSQYLYVKNCEIVEDKDFHARFSVKNKIYLYKINVGEYNAILSDYAYNYCKELDLPLMKEASKLFIGAHDFKAFVTGKHKTCESIIDDIQIRLIGKQIEIEILGKAFYTYMVRNIVAILILIGAKRIEKGDIEYMLTTGKKSLEFAPAPACGLYLKEIKY